MRTPPYMHTDGHDTETAAADSMRAWAPTVRAQVLRLIAHAGQVGLTDDEGARLFGVDHPHADRLTFGRRRHELVIEGKVRKTAMRRPGPSGRNAIVWVYEPPL